MREMNGSPAILRDIVLALFRASAGIYLPRWTDDLTSRGDFDGRDYAIELFNVAASEQRPLRRALREVLRRAEGLCNRPITLLFHTPDATARYYQEVIASRIDNAALSSMLVVRAHGDLSQPFATQLEPVLSMTLPDAA